MLAIAVPLTVRFVVALVIITVQCRVRTAEEEPHRTFPLQAPVPTPPRTSPSNRTGRGRQWRASLVESC